MTMADTGVAPDVEEHIEADASGQEPSAETTPAPAPVESAREKELRDRLAQQGREMANIRQAAGSAITQLATEIRTITARMSEDDRRRVEDAQKRQQAYLNSLPPDKRTSEELRLLRAEVADLRKKPQGTEAVQPAPTTGAENEQQYMARRSKEIVAHAQATFELDKLDLSVLPDNAWESEDDFQAEVTKLAARQKYGSASGGDVASKKPETPEESKARIKQEVLAELGVSTTATPKPAGRAGKAPTAEDVRTATQAYDPKLGPKANLTRLKALRERMPVPK